MATSGSTDFSVDLTNIIKGAARKIGVIAQGETLSAAAFSDFKDALNMMVKRWAAIDIRVWTVREATLFPQPGQIRYGLGGSATDHCTESYVQTTLSAAEAAGQVALSVTSDDGILDNDHIGIVLDSGSVHWSTVGGTPAGDVVTIDDALPSAAAAGAAVFAYTTRLVRPIRIPDSPSAVRRHGIASGNDVPIGPPISRLDYQARPYKTTRGVITEVFYDPQLSTGYLTLWQAPASPLADLVKFTWHKPIEDFDSASDNPDLPQEWIDTLIFNLAVTMAPEYDVPTQKFAQVAALAEQFLDEVKGADRENEAVCFQPDMGR